MASTINVPRDPNTLSNYNNFITTHTIVNFSIDFEKRNISGNVVLSLKSITDAASKEIVLDTSHLHVSNVNLSGKASKWEMLSRFEPYGSALKIVLREGVANGESVDLDISTETTDKCTALGWMTPAQARSDHPYMYTQCQAIHARSIFPCQDTPDVKSTFEFNIKSPLPTFASGLATAVKDLDTEESAATGVRLYSFKQDIPIPSYLFALASGDIAQANIGPRSVVATGPKELKAAKWELEGSTEKFIQTVEHIVYPYQWGSYNVLVLPPSFPYGGMENPIYTYATPTIISGDRENVDVIAHELSHSYSGNLVSNASWEHFWLNEGWTTYLERRIQAAIHGEPHRDFSAIIGWAALQDSVTEFGSEHEFTKLIVDLKGKDPDDAFSSVPYEKGYTFLSYLEQQVGKNKWNKFIPHYFTTFARRSLDSYDFKANLLSFFETDATASDALEKVDWDTWFYKPGLPPKPDFDTSLVDVCYDLASKWEKAKVDNFEPKSQDIKGWSANQIVVFLNRVLAFNSALDKQNTQAMGSTYGFAKSTNVEVVARYYQIALKARDESVYESTAKLLGNVGRMKFVRPLFKQLNEADRALAVETFEKNKNFYHPICRAIVEKDLFGKGKRN
ncbi:leukotriene-A4 hydrolase, partial [Lecanoromycetidae sp. Uapishka_2]